MGGNAEAGVETRNGRKVIAHSACQEYGSRFEAAVIGQ
jgi:hypothetical protein